MKIWKTTHMVQCANGDIRWRETAPGAAPTWFKNLSVHTSPVMKQVTKEEAAALEKKWQAIHNSQTCQQ